MSKLSIPILIACASFGGFIPSNAAAADAGTSETNQTDDDPPTPVPLTVGSMAIASDANLAIEAMSLDVSAERVSYHYRLRNKGAKKLSLEASVALPDLENSNDGKSLYTLPLSKADNPIDLTVESNKQAVATTAHLAAIALGIDRQSELTSAGLPLIPFGEQTDSAIAAAKPDTLDKLTNFGLLTPRDPKQPNAQVIGDWTLKNVRGWTQTIEPGTSDLSVSFMPIKATYQVDAPNLAGFDTLKEQVCLTAATTSVAKALLKTEGALLQVDDIVLASDGPARWLDNPNATITVHKPQQSAVVSFCGIDAVSANKAVVSGKVATSGELGGLRILIFSLAQP